MDIEAFMVVTRAPDVESFARVLVEMAVLCHATDNPTVDWDAPEAVQECAGRLSPFRLPYPLEVTLDQSRDAIDLAKALSLAGIECSILQQPYREPTRGLLAPATFAYSVGGTSAFRLASRSDDTETDAGLRRAFAEVPPAALDALLEQRLDQATSYSR
jgi:hypothetical protein